MINGSHGISAETARRLGRFLGATARFWLNLQIADELAVAERDIGPRVAEGVKPGPLAA